MANSSASAIASGVMLTVTGAACLPLEDLDSFSRPPHAAMAEAGSLPPRVDAPQAPAASRGDQRETPPELPLRPTQAGETSTIAPDDPASDAGDVRAEVTDARIDAPAAMQTLDASESCEGARLAGVCWYLGSPGASCSATCSEHGGYLEGATGHIGVRDQGGSPEACAAVLTALGFARTVRTTARTDGRGVGCHFFGTEDDPWWLSAPAFGADNQLNRARLVCGCAR